MMTAQYPCHFMGTALAQCSNLAIAMRGLYDYGRAYSHRAIFLFQNDLLKSCVLCTIAVQPPCGACAGIRRCSFDVSTGYGLMIFYF